jgi:hypothetical protein
MNRLTHTVLGLGVAALLAGCGSPAPSTSGAPVATEAVSEATSSPTPSGAANATSAPAETPPASVAPSASTSDRLSGEPDPTLTPGTLNPAVTQATIGTTICVSGWTATVRPPSSYTTKLKVEQIVTYGYADTTTASYEEDHLIPLEDGGAPSDPANLWPEPYTAFLPDGRDVGARVKDTFETALKKAVCAGQITLTDAQAQIGIHWVHAFYGIPLGPSPSGAPATTPPSPVGSLPATAPALSFVRLPNPAVPGSAATISIETSAGATCSVKVTWPSGTVSAAAGLKPTPTADEDGVVSWTWNVSESTKAGTGTASVTCLLGAAVTKSATFPVK